MIQIVPTPKDSGCLLQYSFDTYPTPLQVSPAGDKRQHGIITVVVSNPGTKPVYCQQIQLTLPIGDEPLHLTETPDTISAFVYTNDAAKAWEVQNDKNGVLTATPTAGREITSSDSLVIYIYYIQVNKKTGIFPIQIDESTSHSGGSYTSHKYTQSFSKFPHGFFLKDFAAYKEIAKDGKKVLTPITALDNSGVGENVTLAWSGASNARYTISYPDPEKLSEDKSVDIPEGKTSWTSAAPIRDTTTFRLQARAGNGEAKVTASLGTTVVVNTPDIQAKSLEVSGNINTKGKIRENGHDLLPKGCILLWSGTKSGIPPGWTLCNGENDTPDLTGRFIVGAGKSYTAGKTGGVDEITLSQEHMPAHKHSGTTSSAGKHFHKYKVGKPDKPQGWGNSYVLDAEANIHKWGDFCETEVVEAHSHDYTTNTVGNISPKSIPMAPPFYALCYIMKER